MQTRDIHVELPEIDSHEPPPSSLPSSGSGVRPNDRRRSSEDDQPTVLDGRPRHAKPVVQGGPKEVELSVPAFVPSENGALAEPTLHEASRGTTGHGLVGPHARTPIETMAFQEVTRTRIFIRLTLGFAAAMAVACVFLPGDPFATRVLLGTLSLAAIMFVWLDLKMREPSGYTPGRAILVAISALAAALSGIYYFGPFSPAAIILPFGLYFFGAAQCLRSAATIFVASLLTTTGLMGLTATGVISDVGVIRLIGLGSGDALIVTAIVGLTLASTFAVARASRKATLTAIEHHDAIVRVLAKREALLDEARQELDRALHAGGLGRFSDTRHGSFRLGRVIGRGAMGEVYEAEREGTGEPAAVKLLHHQALTDRDLVRRFVREAELSASLDVPNVVRVLEVGGLEAPLPYIAMERLAGEDLSEHLRRSGRMSRAQVVALATDVGRALSAARLAGVVHRDIKPRNIFHARGHDGRGTWKVLDFGVSKLVDNEGTITRGAIVGTPAYMAPEQAQGQVVTHRADLYALAVVCYRALTGRPAFTGQTVHDTIYQVIFTMPPAPSQTGDIPPEFDAVLALGMAKDPGDRFDSAEEFVLCLTLAAAGRLPADVRQRADVVLAKHPWARRSNPSQS